MHCAWKTTARRPILDCGRYLVVEEHSVQLPDGRIIDDWPWVITPDFANVIPVTPDGELLFFRQTKYALDGVVLAPVGGFIEPGEAPLAAARREMMEEVGCESDDWSDLGAFRVDPNRGVAMAHFFLACGVRFVAKPNADDLEVQELVRLSRPAARAALAAGEFKVLAWAAIVTFALDRLDRG